MRILSLIVISALVGTAIGGAMAYVDVHVAGMLAGGASVLPELPNKPPAGVMAPRVQVDQLTFRFGSMQRGTTKSHRFVFTNVGNAPLKLRVGGTSCKCTLSEVAEAPIAPGDSAEVELEWTARTASGEFRQTANILTNDPGMPQVQLQIDGEVTMATSVWPPEFLFDKVAAGSSKAKEVFVMSMFDENLEVGEPELSYEKTRDFLDVEVERVELAELPRENVAAGYRITLTVNQGMPMGRFDQWLKVQTNLEDAEQLEIPVIGRVVGEISMYGAGWNDDRGMLLMGNVKSSKGKRSDLNMVIRGERAAETVIEVAECDPEELVVTIGEAEVLKDGLVRLPLSVEIPAGTRSMARLNTESTDPGVVTLKTTHPNIPELVFQVRFAVER